VACTSDVKESLAPIDELHLDTIHHPGHVHEPEQRQGPGQIGPANGDCPLCDLRGIHAAENARFYRWRKPNVRTSLFRFPARAVSNGC
jgi:hypothetical protein